MVSGLKSINDLFGFNKTNEKEGPDIYFYVPEYQRNYAWEDKQINDFFDDFKTNYNGANKKYYYGTILLQSIENEGSKEKFDIVDGQQRLTTLIVFIKCVLDRIAKIKNRSDSFDDEALSGIVKQCIIYKGNYRLTLQQDDNDFFHTYILKDNPYSDNFRTPSQKRLYHLKERFIDLLNNISDDIAIACIENIMSTNILVYIVYSRSEASLIFETTNDRGKPLTNIEKYNK